MTTHHDTFGPAVRKYRDRLGLSQKKLSERTEGRVTPSHIARIETGELGATPEKLLYLSEALELTEDEQFMLAMAAGHPAREAMPTTAARLDAIERAVHEIRTDLREALTLLRPDTSQSERASRR